MKTILGFGKTNRNTFFNFAFTMSSKKKFICRKNRKPICFHYCELQRRKLNRWKILTKSLFNFNFIENFLHIKLDDAAININARIFFWSMSKLKNYMSRKKCAFKVIILSLPTLHINSFHSNMWVQMKNCVIDFIFPEAI